MGAIRKFAYSKPSKPFSKQTVAGKVGNGITAVGTRVAQWTVRPGVVAYDVGKGKKKR